MISFSVQLKSSEASCRQMWKCSFCHERDANLCKCQFHKQRNCSLNQIFFTWMNIGYWMYAAERPLYACKEEHISKLNTTLQMISETSGFMAPVDIWGCWVLSKQEGWYKIAAVIAMQDMIFWRSDTSFCSNINDRNDKELATVKTNCKLWCNIFSNITWYLHNKCILRKTIQRWKKWYIAKIREIYLNLVWPHVCSINSTIRYWKGILFLYGIILYSQSKT